jgi:hypothetical protein
MFQELETDICETIYLVDGYEVRLWIIVGGTPALDFYRTRDTGESNGGFTQRYPIVEEWAEFIKPKPTLGGRERGRFRHQDPKNIQGPKFDVLPNGEADLIAFVSQNKANMELRNQRYYNLPEILFESPRYHNTEDQYYFRARYEARLNFIGGVIIDAAHMIGQPGTELQEYGGKTWQDLAKTLAKYRREGWYDLTDDEYQEIVNAINNVDNTAPPALWWTERKAIKEVTA